MSTPHQQTPGGAAPGSTNGSASSLSFSADSRRVQHIPLELIDLDPRQSRTRVDPAAIQELQQSIEERGLLEPIRLRLSPAGDRLLAYIGGRRLCAFRALREQDPQRFGTIPAFVDRKEDPQALADSIAENLHRKDLTAVELGAALWEYTTLRGCTQKEVARLLGFTPGYVRALTSKARQVLNAPVLAALDREKPIPKELLLAVPSDPAQHDRFVDAWRRWGDDAVQNLAHEIRSWGSEDEVADPHSIAGTRSARLRRLLGHLRILRSPEFWEAGPLTPGEAALLPHLEYQLRETLQVVEHLTGEDPHPGPSH